MNLRHPASPGADRRPIAFLDSGVGGLTVLHECLVSLCEENFLYFGDTARFPYGERSPTELREFTREIVNYLLDRDPKLLVVACNSATANALAHIRDTVGAAGGDIEVISVIEPESEIAAAVTRSGRVGVLATPATVASGAYRRALRALDPSLDAVEVSCPELAAIIEHGSPFDREVVEMARSYCMPLIENRVDVVILGCTHYPLVAPMLQRILGRDVTLVSSGHAIAAAVQRVLERERLATDASGEGTYAFACTGDPERFRTLGTRFLQMPLEVVSRVDLTQLEAVAS